MPLYDYICTECGHKFETLQRVIDEDLLFCPECTQPKLKKVISASNFVLRGQGWHSPGFKHKDPTIH